MPSGQIHDRITLWSLPVVTGLTAALTRSGNLTLLVSSGFLFSGLLLSPDLDLYSRPFKRWGWFRWIWIPYQKSMRHRSVLSHGPVIGTTLRVLYLVSWLLLLGAIVFALAQAFRDISWSWQQFAQNAVRSLIDYRTEGFALFAGLELGAMSHSLSDWVSSTYKRSKKKTKRKSTNRKLSSSRRSAKK